MTELLKLAEQVKIIVKNAAKLMRTESFSITEKEGKSYNIVTSADVAVQDFLQKELLALLPGSGFLGEENNQDDSKKEFCWVVDPIDGTANFARGMKQSGISVAIRKGNELVLGVVYNPELDDMFMAVKGGGAFLNGKKINVSDRDFEHSIVCTALCLYRKSYTDMCCDILRTLHKECADFRRFGVASLELCYLALGRIELFFELRLFPWDFAAGAVILREAGGTIGTVKWDGNGAHFSDKLVLDGPSPLIAANCCDNIHKISEIVIKNMTNFNPLEYN
ncbi:MAG: inositol monophosphatase family protein [Spirochaetales bacterium]